jgi:HPt (histidine-containing phosphotransfer) domain-containing protein
MTTDRDTYLSVGMNDCLGKPFTSRELWHCLMKYLRPVTWQREDERGSEEANSELRQKMINSFVKNNRGKFNEIKDAIDKSDIKLAHRLVHNLKSNAGHLNETHLVQIVKEVENLLKGGENLVTPVQLEVLERELNTAIMELEPLVREQQKTETAVEPLDSIAARELLEKLGPLLERGNLDSLSLAESLSAVAGSESLIEQIEELDFDLALLTLDELKKKI